MSWTPGWRLSAANGHGRDAQPAFEQGERLFAKADNRERLEAALAEYRAAVAADPAAYAPLARLCQAETLLVAGYEHTRAGKRRAYRAAIQHCEMAMATSAAFRARVTRGESISRAAQELTVGEAEAMFFWVTAVSYYFKECLWGPGHLFHFRWMLRARDLLEHLTRVAPDYNHGAVDFTWGVYYLALPRSAGGDMSASRRRLDAAVAAGPTSLLTRWGRAKYFATKTGDHALFVTDLEWVLAQDPHAASSPYPWNAYFQRDARDMLARIDRGD